MDIVRIAAISTLLLVGCGDELGARLPVAVETSPAPASEPPPDAVRDAFADALRGAYPETVREGRNTTRYELTAAPADVPQLDGRALAVWAFNGQVPGPVLRVRLGDAIEVRLTNRLPQPTTIHWHGVRVPNAMDGVPGVTQDPIPPGGTFTYRFTPKDAGTFWFHPHVRGSEQVERGLYGVLVVDDREPLPYTRDEVWVLDDWRLGPDGQIDPRFVTRHDLAHDGRWGQVVTVNGDAGHEVSVRPGERIRLRLVNTSNGRVYRPDLSGLDAHIIALDGMYTARPLPPDGLELAPGNRADLDITIPTDAEGPVIIIEDRFTRRPIRLAALRVRGEPVSTPRFEAPSNPRVPRWDGARDLAVDVTYELDARSGGPHGIQWTINGTAWGDHEPMQLPAGRWTRVRFANRSGRLHPMHIHGQFFRVIERNGEPVDEPSFRDTILVRPRETVDVGMVPLDWGRWMMHCHILEHAESGMMTEIVVGQ